MVDPEPAQPDSRTLSRGLARVRQRRWLLWGTIGIYLPGLLLALQVGLSSGALAWLFWLWVALLCVVVGLATVVRCPQCARPFHTNGPTFLPVRRCVHCGLPVDADRRRRARPGG